MSKKKEDTKISIISNGKERLEKPIANRSISDASSIAPSEAPSEVEVRQRITTSNSSFKPIQRMVVEYCRNTSIHGLQYLGQRERHFIERVFWIITIVFSLFFCGHLIRNIYVKWDTSPVIVSFSEKSTPVWHIPFPAVTICPETKAKQTVFNFTDIFHQIQDEWLVNNQTAPDEYNLNKYDNKTLEAVAQVCEVYLHKEFQIGKQTVNYDQNLIEILREVAPKFYETFISCRYLDLADTCSKLFHKIVTEEGICYTFNALDGSEVYREETIHEGFPFHKTDKVSSWTLESGYQSVNFYVYPNRALATDSLASLNVILSLFNQDLDYLCRAAVQGFKIALHTPGELPRVSKQYFHVPLSQGVTVSVRPQMMQTSENLMEVSPMRRQCYFNNERYLRYFKLYTQSNCELECLTNHTLETCGCVKFSMPHNASTPVCGLALNDCVNEAAHAPLKKKIEKDLSSKTDNRRGETKCNCLPLCTSITYEHEISQAPFNWEDLFKALGVASDEISGIQFARLSIFFKEGEFITLKRSELYGRTDFIANCGGLLGLFMGVSLLSFVELVYFCSVRLCCHLRMRHNDDRKETNKINPILLQVPPSVTKKNRRKSK